MTRTSRTWSAVALAAATLIALPSFSPIALAAGANASGVGSIQEFSIQGDRADPADIVAGSDGNMWFIEEAKGLISRITPTGTITDFPVAGETPMHLTTGPDGAIWFTAYEGNVVRMTTAGLVTDVFAVSDSAFGGDIVTGPDGNLWVSGTTGGVVRLTTTGATTVIAAPADRLAAGPDGNIWFTSPVDGFTIANVGRITLAGDVTQWPVPPNVNGHTAPLGITAGPDGNVWFTDGFDQIGRVTPAGTVTMYAVGTETPAPSIPWGITGGPDGGVWFTVYQLGRIVRMAPDGSRVGYPLPAPYAGPLGITQGPHNTVWFTEHGSNNIPMNKVGYIKVCGGDKGCSLPSNTKIK